MSVSLSTDTLKWHCPPWGGSVLAPRYDRKAVKPGIVHMGITDFHRGHQAHFIDEILGSNEVGCLNWGISAVSLWPDAKMRYAMRKQDGMYTLAVRSGEEYQTHIIGAYCEYLFAPDDHQKIMHRLCAPSTKIVSVMVSEEDYHLDDAGEIDEASEDVQADLEALQCQRLEDLKEGSFRTLGGYLAATARIRQMEHEVPLAVLGDPLVPAAVLAMAAKAYGQDMRQYIESKWKFPGMVCERAVYSTTPELVEEAQQIHGVADRYPVVCESFVRWVVEDKFPSGRPNWDGVLGGSCLFVDDAAPFAEIQTKVFDGAGQAICYLGLLRGFRHVKDAVADQIVLDFLAKYLAVVTEHAISTPEGIDPDSYKEEVLERLQGSNQDLFDLAQHGTHRIEKCCMSCLPAFPKMDTASVKPLVLLLCFWLRYLVVAADEKDMPYVHAPDERLEELQPLAWAVWKNAEKAKADNGESVRRPPPRDETKAFVSHAFPRVDLGPTVLVEVMASQMMSLRANDVATFLTTVARL